MPVFLFTHRSPSGVPSTACPPATGTAWWCAPRCTSRRPSGWPCAQPMRWMSASAMKWGTSSHLKAAVQQKPSWGLCVCFIPSGYCLPYSSLRGCCKSSQRAAAQSLALHSPVALIQQDGQPTTACEQWFCGKRILYPDWGKSKQKTLLRKVASSILKCNYWRFCD